MRKGDSVFQVGLADSFHDESVTRTGVSFLSWQFVSLAFIIPTKSLTDSFTNIAPRRK